MQKRSNFSGIVCSAAVLLLLTSLARMASAQESTPTRVTANRIPPEERIDAPPTPHPLLPALKIAYNSHDYLNTKVKDYTCRVVKRERIDGVLRSHQYMDAKVRHKWTAGGRLVHPRSVYVKFVGPKYLVGREILWVEGRYDNQMIVRRGGRRFHYVTVEMSPDNDRIYRESHYTVPEMGLKSMVRRLIEIGQSELKYGECDVRFIRDVKIDDRTCTCIQVVHPQRRKQFKYHVARIFVDDEYPIPIRFEAYDWPESSGDDPVLIEEYTFQNLKLNVGLPDDEFRRDHPEYGFRN